MTLLLIMEGIDSGKLTLDDVITPSAHAVSMGGSQIWLAQNEQFILNDLLKAAAIASANDATVALAEHLAGSEEGFVAMMNQRAADLGMKNTTFINCTGLDAPGHISSARDIALMSAELLRHPLITEYTTVWMDSLRDGKTELVNTNKLIRFYEGATGLKTGTTNGAGSCLSASATRNGMSLVAVVMGSVTSDERFGAARGLLDYGFANYEVTPVPAPDPAIEPIKVRKGVSERIEVLTKAPESILLEKGRNKNLVQKITLVDFLEAPVVEGEKIGQISILNNGIELCVYELVAGESVDERTLPLSFKMLYNEMINMS